MIENNGKSYGLVATHSSLHPADFPVGSAQSRAAARMLAEARVNQRRQSTVVIVGMWRGRENIVIGDWHQDSHGGLVRTVSMPSEIGPDDSLRIFGTEKNPLHGEVGVFCFSK